MLKILIEKELKAMLLSPKFTATFAVCAILIILSVFVGINDYKASVKQHETASNLIDQEMREQTSWGNLYTRAHRKPDPMQIFVAGINNDIGRLSTITGFQQIKLQNSNYSDEPIFGVFRFVDLTFIVQIVLSLFAILFTYDAINGEREGGTLQLTFANAVPRVQYIVSKFIGSWLGLVLPLLIPILLGILLVMLYSVPMTGDHWARLFTLLGVSFLYFTFFIAFGLLISALTRRSVTSFLLLLVVWVTFVLIIPRAGVMLAGQIVPVSTVAEIEGQRDGYARERWKQHFEWMENRWEARNTGLQDMSPEEREAYRDDHSWDWMKEDEAERKKVQADISEYDRKLNEDLRNRKAVQEKLGFLISRFSPASSYQLAAMHLAGTDISLKPKYEDAMRDYREKFNAYREQKQKESGNMHGGFRISISSDSGMKISGDRDSGALDISGVPKFEAPEHTLAAGFAPFVSDFGLLSLYTILAFAGAFVAFLRYDVR
ncbi:MAG: ABC transporter permease subunit [bacterium]